MVERLQPQAIIFSDGGPGCRWVGNENGYAHATNWSFLRGNEVYPGYSRYWELQQGHADGDTWTPALLATHIGSLDFGFGQQVGLELGADDYVVKPFDTKEIMARIKAVLRRTSVATEEESKQVDYDDLSINLTNYEMKVKGEVINTPPKELELIYHLASNPNRVFTRDQLLDEVWGFDYYGDSRTVDVHVKRLREKLEGVSDKWALKTVWGVGYKFETKD